MSYERIIEERKFSKKSGSKTDKRSNQDNYTSNDYATSLLSSIGNQGIQGLVKSISGEQKSGETKVVGLESMKKGDILLLHDEKGGTKTHKLISRAQHYFLIMEEGDYHIVHAGIYDGNGNILEASGEKGLRSAPLNGKDKSLYYLVYRLSDADMSDISDFATDIAFSLTTLRGERKEAKPEKLKEGEKYFDLDKDFGRYGTLSAGLGLIRSSSLGSNAKERLSKIANDPYMDRDFYCSNFVVETYNLACEFSDKSLVFNIDYKNVTPKRLQAEIMKTKGWELKGIYIPG
jgi:hypothetical protein